MAWALSLGFCTVLTVLVMSLVAPGFPDVSHGSASKLTAVYLYLTAAVCSVRVLWGLALSRVLSHKLVGVIAVVAVTLGSSLPYLLTLDGSAPGVSRASLWFGNVAAVLRDDVGEVGIHLIYASVWALAAWSVCMPLIFGAFRRFRRPATATPVARAGG